jgi:thioredoxin-related protein
MPRAPRLIALLLALGFVAPVAGQVRFLDNYDNALETAKKDNKLVLLHFTQKGSPTCVRLNKEVFSRAEVGQAAAKKFIAVKVSGDQDKGSKVFQQLGVNVTPTIMILDPQGQELVQDHFLEAAAFVNFLETAVALNTALEQLGKLKKESSAGIVAALKKVSAVEGPRSKKVLREYAENEMMSESVRRTALEGLSKQKEPAADLVPFLGNKIQSLRTIAFSSLKAIGPDAVSALLDGLDAYSPEQRASCYTLAAPHAKNAKLSKDAAFWRTGAPEARVAALKAWKEWWDKNKPAPKE